MCPLAYWVSYHQRYTTWKIFTLIAYTFILIVNFALCQSCVYLVTFRCLFWMGRQKWYRCITLHWDWCDCVCGMGGWKGSTVWAKIVYFIQAEDWLFCGGRIELFSVRHALTFLAKVLQAPLPLVVLYAYGYYYCSHIRSTCFLLSLLTILLVTEGQYHPLSGHKVECIPDWMFISFLPYTVITHQGW